MLNTQKNTHSPYPEPDFCNVNYTTTQTPEQPQLQEHLLS